LFGEKPLEIPKPCSGIERFFEIFIMTKSSPVQQWGCDVVTDSFPSDFLDQLHILTDNDILVVPRRSKGITSGQNGRCYWNANICAQTWGGKVVYGWSLFLLGDSKDAGIQLFGHACWLTPEGKLVDPTFCPGVTESCFVPYTDSLILNGKITQTICDFCFARSTDDLKVSLTLVAEAHGRRFSGIGPGFYSGVGVDYDQFLNKIVYYDALPYELVREVSEGLDPRQQYYLHLMFSPYVCAVDAHTPKLLIHDSSLTFEDMKKRFSLERRSICSLYKGYDVTACFLGEDMVWDSQMIKKPTLLNPSFYSGKFIQDIPPLRKIVNKHSVPTQKKRLQKVVSTAGKYNLSPEEVVMLSNPYFYPHPYLLNKAGWVSIPRLKTADLIAA
jgi:hypothetical protein